MSFFEEDARARRATRRNLNQMRQMGSRPAPRPRSGPRPSEVAGGGCAFLFFILWLLYVAAVLLIIGSVAAIAGDVIGLWEVVEFV